MVSGLVTSPWLQLRIFSGDAREMRIESKSAIKFARSYGEDLKIASSQKPNQPRMDTDEHGSKKPEFLPCSYPCLSVSIRGPCFSLLLVSRDGRIRHFAGFFHQLHIE